MTTHSIFISYSHKDEDWKDRVVLHLRVLELEGLLDIWDDRRIEAGDEWRAEIESAINTTSIAVLLISANFLTSKFILGNEVPQLLARRVQQGVRVIPVIVKPCAWQQVKWLSPIQARPKDGNPLSSRNENQIDADLALLAEEIARFVVPEDLIAIKTDGIVPPKDYRAEKLEDIRKRLLVATTVPELLKLKYEMEAHLSIYTTDFEAMILKNDIREILKREKLILFKSTPILEGRTAHNGPEISADTIIWGLVLFFILLAIISYVIQSWR